MAVPALRIQAMNSAPPRPDGDYVLYWMIANRRTRWNFSLQRAVELARQWRRPIVILEALRVRYRWASDRLHRFVIDGMADNAARLAPLAERGVAYHAYLEPAPGEGSGLLAALAERACAVVTDDFPCFFLPRMLAAVAPRLPVQLEAVDSNGLLPLRAADRVFARAFDFRRWLQRNLPPHLAEDQFPEADPLARLQLPPVKLPAGVARRWPAADLARLRQGAAGLAELPIDHAVRISPLAGGEAAARQTLRAFLRDRLPRYGEERNDPDRDASSGLSPYLHFGHISTHEVCRAALDQEDWSPAQLARQATGQATGWWNLSPPLESFLDELVTWRELGYNFCWQRDDYDQYASLPDWAQATLRKHARDPRPVLYDHAQLEAADTHDPLWNAAQRQLVREGRLHNYLRMLWGKKILQWSPSPQAALESLIELNNKYALDGRNPNSYSGIFWCLGRYDRAWGPERPIFGTIRYMSSENTARKVSVKQYLRTYGPAGAERQDKLF